jgi:hypothetical protein
MESVFFHPGVGSSPCVISKCKELDATFERALATEVKIEFEWYITVTHSIIALQCLQLAPPALHSGMLSGYPAF